MRKFYPAMLNGHKVTAERQGHNWLIGGDSDLSGSISIMSKRDGEHCWYSLRGNRMVFEDWCSENEVNNFYGFLNTYLAEKNQPDCVAA